MSTKYNNLMKELAEDYIKSNINSLLTVTNVYYSKDSFSYDKCTREGFNITVKCYHKHSNQNIFMILNEEKLLNWAKEEDK